MADRTNALREAQGPHTGPATTTRAATLVIATIRGLLLGLLATGDRGRVHDAAESFLATLESRRDPERAQTGTAGRSSLDTHGSGDGDPGDPTPESWRGQAVKRWT